MKRRPGGPLLATMGLLVVAVAAGAFLWSTRALPRQGANTLGGPLLPRSRSAIDALLLNVRGASYRFDRLESGAWTLSGAVADDLEPQAMSALVDSLEAAVAGPLLPGTEPNDRRYDFNGPEGVQLTVHRADGTQADLALGITNPVNGARYASGAGRRFCFTVPGSLRDRLAALPGSARGRTLVPGLETAAVDRIVIEAGDATHVLERHDGRWWLAAPAGATAFGGLAAQYHATYGDRRREANDGPWLQASTRVVRGLVHEVSRANVQQAAPPESNDELKVRWGLQPAWRRVKLEGRGLRPALAGAPGDDGAPPVLAFGPPLDERSAPALRRGNVLVVDRAAVGTLGRPAADLLEMGALPLGALEADILEVAWEGRPLLRGARSAARGDTDGRAAWQAELPAAAGWSGDDADRHGLVRDLVVNLDRQAVIAVLPPCREPDPLRADGRVSLALTFGTGASARTEHRELGWLVQPVDGATAAVWDPATGQLLGITDVVLVSMRNAAALVAPRR